MKIASCVILAFLLVPAQSFAEADLNHVEAGTIQGSVYCDADEDGACGCDEKGLKDIHIQLFIGGCGGMAVQTIHTDKEGNFSFHVPKPGRYFVKVDLDYVCGGRIPTTDTCREVNLGAGETLELSPFGYSNYGK
ncbi:MAG: SdrD B-like domain-containing protein [Lysobacterales bacterium]|jgi:hypothetical protein